MSRRTRGPRTILAGALAAAVAGAGLLGVPADADDGAVAPPSVFRPQLVTVDTPTSGDKAALQPLGLDLTEHAGHDYVEVVLHTPADLQALVDKRFELRRPDPRPGRPRRRDRRDQRGVRRVRRAAPRCRRAATGYRTLRRLQRRHDRACRSASPTLVKKFALKRPSLDGRTIYGVEIGQGVRRAERRASRRSC